MSKFWSRLVVEASDDQRTATLVQPLGYWSSLLQELVEVPAGFVTDFASVPRAFWGIVPPLGKYGEAAIVHDYLYRTQEVDRKTCDKVFLEAMEAKGVRCTQRWLLYSAVRCFGWAAWRSNQRKLNNEPATKV